MWFMDSFLEDVVNIFVNFYGLVLVLNEEDNEEELLDVIIEVRYFKWLFV